MATAIAMDENELRKRARRNVWLALAHGALALGLLAAFVWYQVTH